MGDDGRTRRAASGAGALTVVFVRTCQVGYGDDREQLMNDLMLLLGGVMCAALGGELFVRGAVGLAHWARIAPGIVGATVAAFATSSPETSVAVASALAGDSAIALGDGLGSNVVNVALILGLALLVSGIQSSRDSVRRDFPVAVLVPVLTGALLIDGVLSRSDGCVMLVIFCCWLAATVHSAWRQRAESAASTVGASVEPGERHGLTLLTSALGLAFLVAAGLGIVVGARGLALAFGVDEFVVGATVVAVGTSAPELATTLVAKWRGHDEVGLGTLLGSNIFNGVFVIAVAAIIHPISVARGEALVALAFGIAALLLCYPPRGGFIARRRGVALLLLYLVYLLIVLFARRV